MEICTKTTYQIVLGNAVTICDVFWYGFCFGEIRRTATTSLSQLDLKKSYFYCIYKEGWKENSVCRVWKECLDINIAGLRTQRYAVPSPSVDTFSPDALSRNERSKPTLAEKPPKEEDKRSLEEDLVYTGTIEEERSGSPRCYKNSRQTRLGVAFALSSSVRVFFSTSWNSFHFRSVCPLSDQISSHYVRSTILFRWQVVLVIVFCAYLASPAEKEAPKPYQFGFNIGTQHREEKKGKVDRRVKLVCKAMAILFSSHRRKWNRDWRVRILDCWRLLQYSHVRHGYRGQVPHHRPQAR